MPRPETRNLLRIKGTFDHCTPVNNVIRALSTQGVITVQVSAHGPDSGQITIQAKSSPAQSCMGIVPQFYRTPIEKLSDKIYDINCGAQNGRSESIKVETSIKESVTGCWLVY